MLVAGTAPVILTGLGQLWWGWRGPFQALGGLIIWHLHPGGNPEGRLAGLFDYANIAGAWMALVWPLLLAALLLSFVWSPFLAMLMRLSRVNPSLQPTGGSSNITPPAQPAPSAGPAAAPPGPAPSP